MGQFNMPRRNDEEPQASVEKLQGAPAGFKKILDKKEPQGGISQAQKMLDQGTLPQPKGGFGGMHGMLPEVVKFLADQPAENIKSVLQTVSNFMEQNRTQGQVKERNDEGRFGALLMRQLLDIEPDERARNEPYNAYMNHFRQNQGKHPVEKLFELYLKDAASQRGGQ